MPSIVYVGADHRGWNLKQIIKDHLDQRGETIVDVGNDHYDKDDDYVDFALALSQKVISDHARGILICGSGVGMCLAANKVKGIRAAVAKTPSDAIAAREHEDINVLCLSADLTTDTDIFPVIDAFLDTLFSSEEKHVRRLQKIKSYENKTQVCC